MELKRVVSTADLMAFQMVALSECERAASLVDKRASYLVEPLVVCWGSRTAERKDTWKVWSLAG